MYISQRWRNAITILCIIAMLMAAAIPVAMPKPVQAAEATPAGETVDYFMFPMEGNGWKGTGHNPGKDTTVEIRYISGQWTLGGNNPYTDANGVQGKFSNCTPVPSGNAGGLVAQFGIRTPFYVGNDLTTPVDNDDELQLAMNDCPDLLADNKGTILVEVIIHHFTRTLQGNAYLNNIPVWVNFQMVAKNLTTGVEYKASTVDQLGFYKFEGSNEIPVGDYQLFNYFSDPNCSQNMPKTIHIPQPGDIAPDLQIICQLQKPGLHEPKDGHQIDSDTDVTLSWDQVQYATEYAVELTGPGLPSDGLKSGRISGTSFHVGQLQSGDFHWKVEAYRGTSYSGFVETTFTVKSNIVNKIYGYAYLDGAPASGLYIKVTGPDGKVTATTANDDGSYEFDNLAPGTYYIGHNSSCYTSDGNPQRLDYNGGDQQGPTLLIVCKKPEPVPTPTPHQITIPSTPDCVSGYEYKAPYKKFQSDWITDGDFEYQFATEIAFEGQFCKDGLVLYGFEDGNFDHVAIQYGASHLEFNKKGELKASVDLVAFTQVGASWLSRTDNTYKVFMKNYFDVPKDSKMNVEGSVETSVTVRIVKNTRFNWNFVLSVDKMNIFFGVRYESWQPYVGTEVVVLGTILFGLLLAFDVQSADIPHFTQKPQSDGQFDLYPQLEKAYGVGISELVDPARLVAIPVNLQTGDPIVAIGTGFTPKASIYIEIINIETQFVAMRGESLASETGQIQITMDKIPVGTPTGDYLVVAVDNSSLKSQLENAAQTGERPQIHVGFVQVHITSTDMEIYLPLVSK